MLFAPAILVALTTTVPKVDTTPVAAIAPDLAGLQGVWTACVGPRGRIGVTIEIRGRDVSARIKPAIGPPIETTGHVRIDPTASPKTLDWVGFASPEGGDLPEILGIYSLDGNTLRVRTGGLTAARPAAFDPGDGLLSQVVTLRRAADPR